MKNLILGFILLMAFTAKAQVATSLTQQLGTHPFQYNDTIVYKEARAISFSWNGDSLNADQNAINVLVRVRYYIKRGATKAYLDTVSATAAIPVNPWATHTVIIDAIPGVFINPTTTKVVPIGTPGSVDEFIYWSGLFPTVFGAINNQVVIENSEGNL